MVKDAWRQCCEQQQWPFVVVGAKGVGKSVFAALAYCDWPRGSAYFETAATAASKLKKAEIEGINVGTLDAMRDGALLARWCERAGLLVLDDLTNGLTFANSTKALWRIINERADRPAIYTANGPAESLAATLGESLADRLAQGTVLLWSGESRRQQQGQVFVVS